MLSNDTDLVEPIRIVVNEVRKPLILLSPLHPNPKVSPITGRRPAPSKSLRDAASGVLHIHNGHLRAAQFPDRLPRTGKPDIDDYTARRRRREGKRARNAWGDGGYGGSDDD